MGAPSDERVSLQVGCKKATLPCNRVDPAAVGQRRDVGAITLEVTGQ